MAQRCGMVKCPFRPSDDAVRPTHPPTHPPTHSFIHLPTEPSTYLYIHPPTHPTHHIQATFPFHIPSNAMTIVELRAVASMLGGWLTEARGGGGGGGGWVDEREVEGLINRCNAMAEEMDRGLQEEGVVWVKSRRLGGGKREEEPFSLSSSSSSSSASSKQGEQQQEPFSLSSSSSSSSSSSLVSLYAYEVDGFGSSFLGDDAGIPSLLSLPYLGYTSTTHPLYKRTRRFVLSSSNPFYFQGTAASGVGGEHMGM